MNLRMIKDIISLLEKSGVSENTQVSITVDKNSGIKKNWTMSFNIAELQNGHPSKVEIRIRKETADYEN